MVLREVWNSIIVFHEKWSYRCCWNAVVSVSTLRARFFDHIHTTHTCFLKESRMFLATFSCTILWKIQKLVVCWGQGRARSGNSTYYGMSHVCKYIHIHIHVCENIHVTIHQYEYTYTSEPFNKKVQPDIFFLLTLLTNNSLFIGLCICSFAANAFTGLLLMMFRLALYVFTGVCFLAGCYY